MNNTNTELLQLYKTHSKAKARMILGIVFLAVALFFSYAGMILTSYFYSKTLATVGGVFFFLSVPFFAMGIPFFITGIVTKSKTSRKIQDILRAEEIEKQAVVQTPVKTTTEVKEQAVDQAPVETITEVKEQAVDQAQVQTVNSQNENTTNGFVDIDWEKYKPSNAGISYKLDKKYNFFKATGLVGAVPQGFIDKTFTKCPLCCNSAPDWTITQQTVMSLKGTLYLFKCSCCDGIISMSVPDVTSLANGGKGFVANASVGLTNLMVKASKGKKAGTVYAVIENVGKSGVTKECEGKEFELEQMKEMSTRQ